MCVTAYFQDGKLYCVSPEQSSAYDATVFLDRGVKYNLLSKEDVLILPIPNFKQTGTFPDVTNNEDYILRMCAGNIYKSDAEQGILVMKKACDMMLKSNIQWQHEDYLHLVKMLYKVGGIEEAEKTENIIDERIIFGHTIKSHKKSVDYMLHIALENCAKLNTNLMQIMGGNSCSAYDAMICDRIFCIDGKDKRFMELPILEDTYCHFSPFIYGLSTMHDRHMRKINDIIAYSNRPLIDDRTDEEKKQYNKWLEKIKQPRTFWIEEKQFYYLKYKHPDICPRSKHAFDKLKRENHDEFLKLINILPDKYKEDIL